VSADGPASGQNGDMSRPSGGTGQFARGASAAALKGAGLIGLAVIVGVFLLQRVDTTTASSSTTPVKPPKTATTLHRTNTTTKASPIPSAVEFLVNSKQKEGNVWLSWTR